ncbi:carbohydrate ABC transporter membrane protein 1, CUT1 family [Longilinea arvoryzae]|uniref:Carbohydrate ABC transporter membrane protein 1, CUT1 family n=1 Tax=Longilinea arvoryzae TaxID=360412 RepID=A0A0S7BJS0_9CHLR|nr:sugar ABC transporter permease [Longilinea arvoryzae]GAP14434.1 carbohydrate ABC transporter membrane protein 1, CUT1 family [Longilinea arvoryzae]
MELPIDFRKGKGPSRGAEFSKGVKKSLTAWAYIAPAGLLMAIITFLPQAYQIWMAFTDYGIRNLRFNLLNPETAKFAPNIVGLANFVDILTNNIAIQNYDFWRLLLFNIVWTISNLVFHVSLGVLIALALNSKKLIGRRVYRALFVLPWAIPGYIAALTWRNMFDDRFGAINQLIGVINNWVGTSLPTNTQWLTNAVPPIGGILSFLPLAFYCLLVTNIWLGWPFMMVVATGALQSIPSELYEAAEMDGATGLQKFWSVTVPMIRPAMVPAIMLGTIWTFNNFNVIYFITQGGPFGETQILVTQAFNLVYNQRLYGVAAAFSIVVFCVLFIITMINNRITKATEAYNA